MKRIQHFFRSSVGLLLLVAVAWQLLLTLVGWAVAPEGGLLEHMNQWDAGWYLHIIQFSYGLGGSPAAPAFYPLFPMIIGGIQLLTLQSVSPLLIALFVNTIALWAALVALSQILSHFKVSRNAKIIAIIAFLTFPSAFFMHVFYGEALFVSIAFWTYNFALKRKWWAVGVLLAILTAARLPSLLFVALCGLEYLRAHEWNIKRALNRSILWFMLAPVGLITYGIYLAFIRHDFLAMFAAYDATNDWTYQHFSLNIFATLGESIYTGVLGVFSPARYMHFINEFLPMVAITLIIAAAIYLLISKKKPSIPLFVFGLLSIILFSLNSNVVSVHRYALPCIVLYVAAAVLYRKGVRVFILYGICTAMAILQCFLFIKFVSGAFAG